MTNHDREGTGYVCTLCGEMMFADELVHGMQCTWCGVSTHLKEIYLHERWDGEKLTLDHTETYRTRHGVGEWITRNENQLQ